VDADGYLSAYGLDAPPKDVMPELNKEVASGGMRLPGWFRLRMKPLVRILIGMNYSQFRAAASLVIDATPEELYDFIADMPRMREISPVCVGGEWEGEARGVGATFMGSNSAPTLDWQARMRVVAADRPRAYAWCNLGGPLLPLSDDLPHNVRWSYEFTPVEGGTRVEEAWQLLETAGQRYNEVVETCDYSVDPRLIERRNEEHLHNLRRATQSSIEQTLARLKQLFEQ
jgi:hypothetical protein